MVTWSFMKEWLEIHGLCTVSKRGGNRPEMDKNAQEGIQSLLQELHG
jgi:hypothetical protein